MIYPDHAAFTPREQVAALLHAEPEELVFTGGGAEANALAFPRVT
jgi:cysteine sulfinate desulfinase/cysteine desulfurase-like protein